jgi:hypothetical protein
MGPVFHGRFHKADVQPVESGKGRGLGLTFKLKDFLPSAITWDYYRINMLVVKIIPRTSPAYPGEPNGRGINMGYLDFDSSTAPVVFTDMLNMQNMKKWYSDKIMTFKWRPRTTGGLTNVETGGVVAASVNKPKVWINSSNWDILHYGLKLWLVNNEPTKQISYDIWTTAYISFKQPLISKSF